MAAEDTTKDPGTETSSGGAPSPENAGNLKDDISKILKEVKLPERRRTSSEAPPAEKRYDTALGASIEDVLNEQPTSTPAPAPPPPPPAKDDSSVVPLHTMKGDVQEAMREQKISLVRAAALEQEKRAGAAPADIMPEEKARGGHLALMLVVVTVLILLGAGALGAVYLIGHQPQQTTPQSASIIFAEKTIPFSIDNQTSDSLKRSLSGVIADSAGTLGSITRLLPAVAATSTTGAPAQERPATFEEFMTALGTAPPADLYRAVGPDFFFGVHTAEVQAPLFIIPVVSYGQAFSDMLAWESTMDANLAPIFPAVSPITQSPGGTSQARTFQDEVVQNYDLRVLKDDQGNTVFYYFFPSQSLLVIAQSPSSFSEILSRLRAGQKL